MGDEAMRRQWLAMLAKLVAPENPVPAAKALAAMLPFLADLPDEAFFGESLAAVAGQCPRLPSYAELRAAIEAHWRALRQARVVAEPGPGELGEADRMWLRYWRERAAAGFAARDGEPLSADGRPAAERARERAKSLVRQCSPAAWAVIEAEGGDERQ